MKPVVSRFLKYASIDTQGNESVMSCPSNENQRFLAELLKDELEEMGVPEAEIDENSFLYARIPANTKKEVPALAFLPIWTPVLTFRVEISDISLLKIMMEKILY